MCNQLFYRIYFSRYIYYICILCHDILVDIFQKGLLGFSVDKDLAAFWVSYEAEDTSVSSEHVVEKVVEVMKLYTDRTPFVPSIRRRE